MRRTVPEVDARSHDARGGRLPAVQNALFVPQGDAWLPTDCARGPWTPDALHGGPVAALVARAAESCEPAADVHLVRLTLELLRPVPVAPLRVSATLSRPGRKVQVVDVVVADARSELAWGRALRIRRLEETDEATPASPKGPSAKTADGDGAPPGPDKSYPTPPPVGGYTAFHNAGAELRFVRGAFAALGPATVWVRLAVPVVAGEAPSPVQRVAAAADFGNGVSAVLDFARWRFINPDLTVFVHRPPRGEWVCLDATTQLGTSGAGLAHCTLWDREGPVGRSVQSLLVEPR